MPIRVTSWSQTPNPNARKLTLSAALSPSVRSFRTAVEAAAEPIAARLFSVSGVAGLYFGGEWLTVNKDSDAEWPALQRQVEQVLAEV